MRLEMFEAMTWVNLHGYRDQFSFDSICRVFVLEPGVLRRQLNAIAAISFGFSVSLGDLTMWKAVTFVSAVATRAMLALLIFLVEKADIGADWTLLAMWFGFSDRLLPNPRLASADNSQAQRCRHRAPTLYRKFESKKQR
jgi:hypothetical protein